MDRNAAQGFHNGLHQKADRCVPIGASLVLALAQSCSAMLHRVSEEYVKKGFNGAANGHRGGK